MILILLEALVALLLLVLIVWWTMFAGRRNGELPDAPAPDASEQAALPAPAQDDDGGTPKPPH